MQSAITTSARQDVCKQDGATPADPFDFGAGHVVPNGAADPGLVHPGDFDDYRAFLRSQGLCRFCFGTDEAPVVPPTDLDVASVTVRALAGRRTVTRSVRSVGASARYRPVVAAPEGVDVSVTPRELVLARGETGTYRVSFTASREPAFDRYAFGSVTWSDGRGGHAVRVPLVVRPVRLRAPASLTGTGTSGTSTLSVQFGYAPTFAAAPHGLVAATRDTRRIADDPTNDFDTSAPASNQGIPVHDITVAPGGPPRPLRAP